MAQLGEGGMLALCHRYERLNKLSEKRAKKLEDSKKLQEFLRDVDEVMCGDVCVCSVNVGLSNSVLLPTTSPPLLSPRIFILPLSLNHILPSLFPPPSLLFSPPPPPLPSSPSRPRRGSVRRCRRLQTRLTKIPPTSRRSYRSTKPLRPS